MFILHGCLNCERDILVNYCCAATPLEDWKLENLKLLSFGSSGSASKRRPVVIARGDPCREILPLSSAAVNGHLLGLAALRLDF